MKLHLKVTGFILLGFILVMGIVACRRAGSDPQNTGEDSGTEAADPEAVDLSEYRIVLYADASDALAEETNLLRDAIRACTGVTLRIEHDTAAVPNENQKEILIGKTNREQSEAVLNNLEGNGFIIARQNGNILINGTADSKSAIGTVLCDAMEYFIENIVRKNSSSATISMKDGFVYTVNYQTVELVKMGTTKYTVVYSDSLDDQVEESGYANRGIDYEVRLAMDIQEKLRSFGCSVVLTSDKAEPAENEILVGKTNRSESTRFLNGIAQTQYGVGALNGKIVVAGHNTASTVLAAEAFLRMIADSTKGNNVSLLLGSYGVRSNRNWVLNFPAYEGGTVSGSSESYYNALQHYITGTTAEEYKAYCIKLESLGYAKTMSNEIDGNLFAAYTTKDILIYVYYVPTENSVRLIVGDPDQVNLPQNGGNYQKITDVTVTQIQLDFSTNSGGMGYIITLEDGSFLMIDSGSGTSVSAAAKGKENLDHVRIWNLLNQLNRRADKKIIIRGWFITHCHADHIQVFQRFCEEYGSKVTIEGYYECVVPYSVGYNARNPEYWVPSGRVEKMAGNVNGGMDMVMLHTGMHFSMYGVEIDILFTVEDLYPRALHYYNNSSTVFRFTVNGYRLLILGDVFTDASNILVSRYPTALRSDMVQIAHHGNQGGTKALYRQIAPAVALWPTSSSLFADMISGKGQASFYVVDYFIYTELNVKEHYTNSDYSVELVLPYRERTAVKHIVSSVDQFP